MRSAAVLISAALCLSTAWATQGIDYATAETKATHQCWKNAGMSFAIPRAWRSYGSFDPNGPTNVANARAAGFQFVDIYMFPCRGKSATSQV